MADNIHWQNKYTTWLATLTYNSELTGYLTMLINNTLTDSVIHKTNIINDGNITAKAPNNMTANILNITANNPNNITTNTLTNKTTNNPNNITANTLHNITSNTNKRHVLPKYQTTYHITQTTNRADSRNKYRKSAKIAKPTY